MDHTTNTKHRTPNTLSRILTFWSIRFGNIKRKSEICVCCAAFPIENLCPGINYPKNKYFDCHFGGNSKSTFYNRFMKHIHLQKIRYQCFISMAPIDLNRFDHSWWWHWKSSFERNIIFSKPFLSSMVFEWRT